MLEGEGGNPGQLVYVGFVFQQTTGGGGGGRDDPGQVVYAGCWLCPVITTNLLGGGGGLSWTGYIRWLLALSCHHNKPPGGGWGGRGLTLDRLYTLVAGFVLSSQQTSWWGEGVDPGQCCICWLLALSCHHNKPPGVGGG